MNYRLFKKKRSVAYLAAIIFGLIVIMGCARDKTGEVNDAHPTADAMEAIGDAVEGALSISDKVPSRFPKEIPIPQGAQDIASMEQGDSITVSFEVNKSFDETLKIYKEYFKSAGYRMENDTLVEEAYIGTGTLEGNTFLVMISLTTEDKQLSSVSLTYQFKS